MHFLKAITGTLALAACAALAPGAQAQTLQVLTAGSSAQFGPFAVAAYSLAQAGGAKAYHYTVKSGACPGSSCYAYISDTARNSSIPLEPGNLWVAWSSNGIWAYLSVDSTVGVRAFSAVPRADLDLAALASLPVSATTNYTFWADGTNDTALTTTVYNALAGKPFTAANTDIRPEDALFATNRALNTLGYGSYPDPRSGHSGQYLIGNPIKSFFSTSIANPVSFAIAGGADPFTGKVGPAEVTIPVGAAPIVFVASTATGSDVANASNITTANAASLFSGLGGCAASLVTGATGPISPVLREPLSGTMNTTEFTVFEPGDPSSGHSQETGVNPNATGGNPLDLACGSAFRYRAVGTGDDINNVISHASTLGYAFFSYESVGGGKTDRYLEYNGVDPLYPASHTYNGSLPTCPVVNGQYSCPIAAGTSFPGIRNNTYKAWSLYRVVTDSTGQAKVQTLVNKAEALVNSNIPDFIPFAPQCPLSKTGAADPGLDVYREHFVPSTITTIPDTVTITANDGSHPANTTCSINGKSYVALTVGGGTESGGDVGGNIEGPFTSAPPTPYPTEGQPH